MKELVKTLTSEFSDKEYAHSYIEEFSNMEIAAQIKVLREQRGLTQEQLAELADMKQTRVSKLEDVDFNAWTIKTLRKLARAFDLSVKITFEKVSSRILDINNISKKELERTSREEDLKEFSSNGFSDGNYSDTWCIITSINAQAQSVPLVAPANDRWSGQYESKTAAAL